MSLKLLIDSTCDLPSRVLEKFNINQVPLIVTIKDKAFRDGVDIQLEDVYRVMRDGIVPKTSQVSPDSFLTTFTEYCKNGDDFIYISLSSKLSGTYNLAKLMAEEVKETYPDRQIAVIDSKGGSIGTGLIVLQASLIIKHGARFDEVRDYIIDATNRIEHVFTISNLEWLAKGGRIPRSVGKMGDFLNIKPLLDVQDGKLRPLQMVRGRKKALRNLLQHVSERIGDFTNQYIGIAHADTIDTAREVEQMIKEKYPESRTFIQQIGSVLGVHLGIGGVGVFFFNSKPNQYFYLD